MSKKMPRGVPSRYVNLHPSERAIAKKTKMLKALAKKCADSSLRLDRDLSVLQEYAVLSGVSNAVCLLNHYREHIGVIELFLNDHSGHHYLRFSAL